MTSTMATNMPYLRLLPADLVIKARPEGAINAMGALRYDFDIRGRRK